MGGPEATALLYVSLIASGGGGRGGEGSRVIVDGSEATASLYVSLIASGGGGGGGSALHIRDRGMYYCMREGGIGGIGIRLSCRFFCQGFYYPRYDT